MSLAFDLLARRLARAIQLSTLAVPALGACGGNVVVDTHASSGSGSGGAGGAPSTGGVGGAAAACLTVTSTGAIMGPSMLQETRCFPGTPGQSCPAAADALPTLMKTMPDCYAPVSVQAACTGPAGSCCYNVTSQLECKGRPFLVDGIPRTATVLPGSREWGAGEGFDVPPDLPLGARAALARAFRSDALAEHASVASFGRFALELLAVGAPAALVAAAHEAALDEVRHARIGFGLASAFEGAPLGPSAFPFPAGLALRNELAPFAHATAIEGCIRETLAALLAAERAALATHPAVRAALLSIAEDEARHAELAWRTVAWALRAGGPEVERAVFEALADAASHVPAPEPPGEGVDLRAYGVLDGEATSAIFARGLAEVIAPSARALGVHREGFEVVSVPGASAGLASAD